jgi:hypothetical protein
MSRRFIMSVVCVALLAGPGVSGTTTEPRTELVSVDSAGAQGNNYSEYAAISADGRFVAFVSAASNLVPGDTNDRNDIFVRDRQSGTTERVSTSSAGVQANDHSGPPLAGTSIAISADGRYVAFTSWATNLVSDDSNGTADVFVHDRVTNETERVSVGLNGQGNNVSGSGTIAISGDGRFVAFDSFASNLVEGDTTNAFFGLDVFVRDRSTAQTERVSVSDTGGEANNGSAWPAISSDGRFVAFTTAASNLVAGDTNGVLDVVVFDRQSHTVELVSLTNDGVQGNLDSGVASSFGAPVSISGDGRFVAFRSFAFNLASGATNNRTDIYVRDRMSRTTERVSIGVEQGTFSTAISADGRFVAFDGFVALGAPIVEVFLHDREAHTTELASVNGAAGSLGPAISADGRFVAFYSTSATLVEGDSNNADDVFVRDRGAVVDTEPPLLTVPALITVDATSPAGATVTFFASAIDNVDGAVAVNCSPASGSTFAVGPTTVTCAATDAAGNIATATFLVTVRPFFVPFAAFKAALEIEPTEVELKAVFQLGATSNGIQPRTEAVTLKVGTVEWTIPAGSFVDDGNGRVRARVLGLDARIRPLKAGALELRVDLPRDLAGLLGHSVDVALTIGNDRGSTTAVVEAE